MRCGEAQNANRAPNYDTEKTKVRMILLRQPPVMDITSGGLAPYDLDGHAQKRDLWQIAPGI